MSCPRFLFFSNIGYGANVLPFISMIEKPALEEVCDFKLDTKTYPVSFYGITDIPPSYSIFHALFTNDMKKMEKILQQNKDLTYIQPYVSGTLGGNCTSVHRMTIRTHLWHNMNALEMAYLLQHHEGILLLKKYGRRIWHVRSITNTTSFGDHAIQLARKYQRDDIVQQLESERL